MAAGLLNQSADSIPATERSLSHKTKTTAETFVCLDCSSSGLTHVTGWVLVL